MDRNLFVAIGIIAIVLYFVVSQGNQTAVQNGVQVVNGTTSETTGGININLGDAPLLPWIGLIICIAYILWKHTKGQKKGYNDAEEAINDVKARLKNIQISPVTIDAFQFSNPEDKIEFVGKLRCLNEKYKYYGKWQDFEIRKNGNLKLDLPKPYSESLPSRPKTRIIIKKEKPKEVEKK